MVVKFGCDADSNTVALVFLVGCLTLVLLLVLVTREHPPIVKR